MHVPAQGRLLLAYDRDIIFRLAGDDAVITAHARIHVDRHAPRVRLIGVRIGLVQRQFRGRLFLFSKIGFFLILLQGGCAYQWTRAGRRLHCLVALGRGELVGASRLTNREPAGEPGRRAETHLIHIEPCSGTHPARTASSIAQKDSDGIIRMTNLDPDWSCNLLTVEFELNHVLGFESHSIRHGRTQQGWIVPGDLVHRLGQLLQPAVVN